MKNKPLLIYALLSLLYIWIAPLLWQKLSHLHITESYYTSNFLFVFLTLVFVAFSQRRTPIENHQLPSDVHQLSTLIDSMVDFVCFKDGDGRWLQTNKFGLELFQLENVDYRGKTDKELAEYTEFYREALIFCQEHSDQIAWECRKVTRCEEVIPMPNGEQKTFDTIKHPLFYKDGTRKGLVVIGRDITEKKLAEERLLRSEKLSVIGELAASVAHEIRNPLTALKGFVQFIRPSDHKNDHFYEIMLSELERINEIVSELLLLAKPQKVRFSDVNLNQTIEQVISLLETQAKMTNVTIQFIEKSNVDLKCEQNHIKQLLINLIKNAIEASPHGGHIEVVLDQNQKKSAVIYVRDFGVGIPSEELNRLGEPFFSSKEAGTGLGLTVSFKIVENHCGTMSFVSEKDKGTEVSIVLPKNEKIHTSPPLISANSGII